MLREVEPNIWFPEVSDLIYEKSNALPQEFCEHMIQKFEYSLGVDPEETNYESINNGDYVNREYFYIESNDYWHTDTENFLSYISVHVSNYIKNLGMIGREFISNLYKNNNLNIDSIKICKYHTKDSQFNWHQDTDIVRYYQSEKVIAFRELQIICYLNDVDSGGETHYPVFDTKVKPKMGKILIAPVGFPFYHKAYQPNSNVKYNIVFQLSRKIDYEIVSKDK